MTKGLFVARPYSIGFVCSTLCANPDPYSPSFPPLVEEKNVP